MKTDTIKRIEECKLIVNMKGFSADMLLYSAEALIKGGIKAIEIPFTPNCSEEAERESLLKLAALKKCFGKDISVGAGNVFSDRLVKLSKGAGADFISAPNVSREVLERADAVGVMAIAGGYTVSEIVDAAGMGADFVSLYPSNCSPEYASAVVEALPHIRIMAAGGVEYNNILPLSKAGIKYFTVGGSLANVTLAEKQEYGIMEMEAKRYIELISKL